MVAATIRDIAVWLEAEVLCGRQHLDRRVRRVHACDLMSDLLTFSQDGGLLLTGLAAAQSVRTAEVAGFRGVVLVRAKQPAEVVVELSKELELPLLTCRHSMFNAAGILCAHGLRGVADYTKTGA